jgi:hypothetical protein
MGKLLKSELIERLKAGEESAFEELVSVAVQEALRLLPAVNEVILKQAGGISALSTKFYQDNPELVSQKKLVAQTIERLESENPGMDFEQLLKLAGPEAKRAAKLIPNQPTAGPKRRRLDEIDSVVGNL